MKFHFPLQVPTDRVLTVTQPFGVTSNTLEPAGPHGEPHFHYGVDVIDGDSAETYGTPIACPFVDAKLESYQFDGPATTTTNFIKLVGVGASGKKYEMVLAHISAVFFRDSYKEGDIVALVGNNGMVSPVPTPANPFGGSHLHLGVQVDGVWDDPLKYFDIGSPFRGPEHPATNGLPRLEWALDLLKAQLAKLLGNKNG